MSYETISFLTVIKTFGFKHQDAFAIRDVLGSEMGNRVDAHEQALKYASYGISANEDEMNRWSELLEWFDGDLDCAPRYDANTHELVRAPTQEYFDLQAEFDDLDARRVAGLALEAVEAAKNMREWRAANKKAKAA